MSITDRYIGRQVLFGTIASVLVLTVVFGLGTILKQVVPLLEENALTLERLLEFIGSILPFAIAYTLPWGFLTSILLTFGRMSAGNELLSLRMSGLSMSRISRAVLALAILFTAICFWLNLVVSPAAKARMRSIFTQLVRDDPSLLLSKKTGKQKEALEGWLLDGEREGAETAKDVRMVQLDAKEGHRPTVWVFAKSMRLARPGDNDTTIQLELSDGVQVERRNPQKPRDMDLAQPGITMENLPLEVPLQARREKPLKPGEMSLAQLWQGIGDESAAKKKRASFRTEINRRYSTSLACLAFCLVGIPMGITAHRRETSAGFVLSLIVAVSYFAFIALGELVQKNEGLLPAIIMWTPSVLFISLGLFLMYRLNRR